MTLRITSGVYGIGSFGLYGSREGRPKRGDEVIRVWFCGGYRPRPGGFRDMNSICAHNTRQQARACPRRPRNTR